MSAPLTGTPEAQQTQPPAQPAEDEHPILDAAETAAVALLALWLLSLPARAAVTLPADLVAQLVALGLDPKAVRAAGRIALGGPLAGRSRRRVTGVPSAVAQTASDEPRMRALFILNAAKRLTVALAGGVAPLPAFRNEARYFELHRAAAKRRLWAAGQVDAAAQVATWLEWRTARDQRVTPACRAMEGHVFTVDQPPKIGWPGSVHPACRCYPVPFGTPRLGALPTLVAVR